MAEQASPIELRLQRERRARRQAETVAEDALRQLYEAVGELRRAKAVLDETTDLVSIATVDGRARYLNRALLEHLGLEADTRPETINVFELLTDSSREELLDVVLPAIEDKGLWRGELSLARPTTGGEMPVSQVVIGHKGDAGALESLASISRDITERIAMEQQLTHLALHDALTGLPNRRLFFDRLGRAAARADRIDRPAGVFYADVDGFKGVNDELGHDAGDTLLVTVAERLSRSVRSEDTVCRLGGDEFCVLCEDVGDAAGAERLAERFLDRVAEPIRLGDQILSVTLSVGIVIVEGDVRDPEELLRDADVAMYQAKRSGKGRAVLFSS